VLDKRIVNSEKNAKVEQFASFKNFVGKTENFKVDLFIDFEPAK
jgi:hypothetical protein